MRKSSKPKFTDAHDRLDELLRQAWSISDSDLELIKPGRVDDALSLLDRPDLADHPFANRTRADLDEPHVHLLKVLRDPQFFPFTCRHLLSNDGNKPLRLLPMQQVGLLELWYRQFPMLVATRAWGKSYLLAIYILLRLTFHQGSKVVIVASAFRQAKVVFEYMEKIWHSSPVFRDLVAGRGLRGRNAGPRRDIDRCEMVIGDSVAMALPLGDGKKIRGLRATTVICEEFASVAEEIYSTVVQGFGAVSADPVQNVEDLQRKRILQRLGLWSQEMDAEEARLVRGNQSVLSGTAYYAFNHFARYHREYRQIIHSRGDPDRLAEIFNGPPMPGFDHRAYSIVRIPAEMMPPGYMDAATLSRAKQTTHVGIYQMEYGACLVPDTLVVTDRGVRRIVDIKAGDMVLTHRGRFRPVTGITTRQSTDNMISLTTAGLNWPAVATGDHPFWTGGDDGWRHLDELQGHTKVARLTELNGNRWLDVRARVSNYMERADFIYPRASQSKFTREQVAAIRASDLSQSELARQYGVRQATIHGVLCSRRPKNAIPATIPLNYDFGLIVGYYASEGSIGAEGRAVGFALDGHVNAKLSSYVDQLTNACVSVFGFRPKHYRSKTNTLNVIINQRLVADLMRSICPGVSHTKTIDPEVLYSNEDFLRGFIAGYWNGDGHQSDQRDMVVAGCVNPGLLSQIRVALSYFGLPSSIRQAWHETGFAASLITSLVMYGWNAREFKRIFYGTPNTKPKGRLSVDLDEEATLLPIRGKQPSDYVGPVYNLHVEEDESYSLLNATVHNCFSSDSSGFYRAAAIQACVVGNPDNPRPPKFPSCGVVDFTATLRGDPNRRYYYGIDPASEHDRFAITIVEAWGDHRRVVYCWTSDKKGHRARLKRGLAQEKDFYKFAVRKIRDLMAVFPAARILIDAGGGGLAVREAFRDEDKLLPGEKPLYEVVDEKKPNETDHLPGEHILEMVQFRDTAWVVEANHGMKKDLDAQELLFPRLDSVAIGKEWAARKEAGEAVAEDAEQMMLYDTLEDCAWEIEQLKAELASIVLTTTPKGLEHWDTPDAQTNRGRSAAHRMRKDRYSALLMANMGARREMRAIAPEGVQFTDGVGGFVQTVGRKKREPVDPRDHYRAPPWFLEGLQRMGAGGRGVQR